MGDTAHLNTLPLQDLHEQAGARFGGFAGWNMPITYPLGVMKEHLHTREHAGLFDISHMKLIEISGADAAALLAETCPLDPIVLKEGQSKYTFFLNDNGGVMDDLIVTRLGEDRFMVVANAGNADADIEHLNEAASGKDVKINPLDRVFLALQGPEAEAVINDAGLAGAALAFMSGFEPKAGWFMTRSGYTGEDGFEVGVPADEARALAMKLLADERVEWIGPLLATVCALKPVSACTVRTSRRKRILFRRASHGQSPSLCAKRLHLMVQRPCWTRSPRAHLPSASA